MDLVCLNGKFLPSDEPLFTVQNRSFKWGDGVFETIKVSKGKIQMYQFHFDRLFLSLRLLQMELNETADQKNLTANILELCNRNKCGVLARVRLAVYRDQENKAGYVVEAVPLSEEVNHWNERGLKIDLYPYARKNPDAFSNLKTANFLPYVLADM